MMGEPAFPYPGQLALKGEMIAREVTMAKERSRMALAEVLATTARAWHEAACGAEKEKLAEELKQNAEGLLETARSRVRTGQTDASELYEMEAELAEAVNAIADARAETARARVTLATSLGRDPAAPLALAEAPDPPAEIPSLAAAQALAATHAPAIRMARAEAKSTAVAIRMAEGMSLGETPAPAAGPDLAWIRELREREASLLKSQEEAGRDTERRVADAWTALDSARRRFRVAAESLVPLSRKALDERMALYQAGRTGATELLEAWQRHVDARREVVEARRDSGMAAGELMAAAGVRLDLIPSDDRK
jgi:outer membrane protein TolC